MSRMPIGTFVEGLRAALKRKDGYIMGATGQDPKKWSVTSWWYTQYSGEQKKKALYWREHAARVWDCNGMAEGLYKDYTGIDINTKARYNYSQWCDPKGTGEIPEQYRVPGAAVFIHSSSSGYITHVGYLDEPTGDGDWYVIEARGVMYGVVRTRLSERGWNRWGLMTKYFDYGDEPKELALGDRTLRKGDGGNDVKTLQSLLNELGFDSGEADGMFGAKTEQGVERFQAFAGLDADGIYGPLTHAALMAEADTDAEEEPAETGERVQVFASGRWNVRKGPSTSYGVITVIDGGTEWPYIATASNGWLCMPIGDTTGWVSPKCAKIK